ncbi:MAG: hypothetical protein ABL308_13825 [Oceanicaulis sp.]
MARERDDDREEKPGQARPDAPEATPARPENAPLDAADAGPDAETPRGPTSRLKAQIETGASGDKVAYPDPGASPLGTDDEAAGRPPEPERVEMSMKAEHRADPAGHPPRQTAPRPGPVEDGAPPRVETSAKFKLGVAAAAALVIVIALVVALS